MKRDGGLAWTYVESSAILEWLLAQPDAAVVQAELAAARRLVTSHLTLLGCARAIARTAGSQQAQAQASLRALATTLELAPIDLDLLDPLGRPFAIEPVRTLDAIHLCTAARLRSLQEKVGFLTLDGRVRSNAAAMGFAVLPER